MSEMEYYPDEQEEDRTPSIPPSWTHQSHGSLPPAYLQPNNNQGQSLSMQSNSQQAPMTVDGYNYESYRRMSSATVSYPAEHSMQGQDEVPLPYPQQMHGYAHDFGANAGGHPPQSSYVNNPPHNPDQHGFQTLEVARNYDLDSRKSRPADLEVPPDQYVNEPLTPMVPASSEVAASILSSIQCNNCGKIFRGPHASGNLTRHRKSQKCQSSTRSCVYPCDVQDCGKVYQRSDALLTHKRKRHGAPGPVKKN